VIPGTDRRLPRRGRAHAGIQELVVEAGARLRDVVEVHHTDEGVVEPVEEEVAGRKADRAAVERGDLARHRVPHVRVVQRLDQDRLAPDPSQEVEVLPQRELAPEVPGVDLAGGLDIAEEETGEEAVALLAPQVVEDVPAEPERRLSETGESPGNPLP
jgi:hypothetical protein